MKFIFFLLLLVIFSGFSFTDVFADVRIVPGQNDVTFVINEFGGDIKRIIIQQVNANGHAGTIEFNKSYSCPNTSGSGLVRVNEAQGYSHGHFVFIAACTNPTITNSFKCPPVLSTGDSVIDCPKIPSLPVSDFDVANFSVPPWIKQTSGWWANGQISDDEFVNAIKFLIQEKIIPGYEVAIKSSSIEKNSNVPKWIKNNAGWWADGSIDDSDFLSGIDYLLETKIINIPNIVKLEEEGEEDPTSGIYIDKSNSGEFDEGNVPFSLYQNWLKLYPSDCENEYEKQFSSPSHVHLWKFIETCIDEDGNVVGTTTWFYDENGNLIMVSQTPDPSTGAPFSSNDVSIIRGDPNNSIIGIECWGDSNEGLFSKVVKDDKGNYVVYDPEVILTPIDESTFTTPVDGSSFVDPDFKSQESVIIYPECKDVDWIPDEFQKGSRVDIVYDSKGNVVTETHYDENEVYVGKVQYHYDAAGNLIEIVYFDKNGNTIGFLECIRNSAIPKQILEIQCLDGNRNLQETEEITYDGDGKVIQRTKTIHVITESETMVLDEDEQNESVTLPPLPISCVDPSINLVSWWDGETTFRSSGTGDSLFELETVAIDQFYANDGIVKNGGTTTTGKVGNAFSFDGIDDSILIENSPTLNFGTNEMTVMAWVKTDFIGGTANDFIITKSSGGSDAQFTIGYRANSNGNAWFAMQDPISGELGWAESPSSIADGVWHHIAGVRDGITMELYIDGQKVSTDTTAFPISATSDNNVVIGGRENLSNNPFFNGLIDEVAIFDTNLSSSDINAIYLANDQGFCKSSYQE